MEGVAIQTEFDDTVYMYSRRSGPRKHTNTPDFKALSPRQVAYLKWIGTLIPALLKAVNRGAEESRWILGRRQLNDGRQAELSLVARAPKDEGRGGYVKGGAADVESTGDAENDANRPVGRAADKI